MCGTEASLEPRDGQTGLTAWASRGRARRARRRRQQGQSKASWFDSNTQGDGHDRGRAGREDLLLRSMDRGMVWRVGVQEWVRRRRVIAGWIFFGQVGVDGGAVMEGGNWRQTGGRLEANQMVARNGGEESERGTGQLVNLVQVLKVGFDARRQMPGKARRTTAFGHQWWAANRQTIADGLKLQCAPVYTSSSGPSGWYSVHPVYRASFWLSPGYQATLADEVCSPISGI